MPQIDVRCCISRSANPFVNLAIEEWLFRKTPVATPILLLWRNSPCVVIGRNQNPWKECDVQALEHDGVPWVRRKSGGGAVYHDLGNSIYSVIEPRAAFTRRKNAKLVARALTHLDVPASVNDRHDIVVDGKKVSGSAFKLTGQRAYHHGTMLIDTNLANLGKYLKVIKPGLQTKGVPSVPSPVTRLREYSYTVDHSGFCEAVKDEFQRAYDVRDLQTIEFTDSIVDREPFVRETLDELVSDDWRLGQTPEFSHIMSIDGTTCTMRGRSGKLLSVEFTPPEGEEDDLFPAGLEDLRSCLEGQWYHPNTVLAGWDEMLAMQRGAIMDTHPTMQRLHHYIIKLARAL